jgi:general secretion pathway protein L
MPNLNSTIDLDVNMFLHWWKHELSFLVPEKIKQLFNDSQGFIIIKAQNNQLILSYQLDGQVEQLATLERDQSAIDRYQDLLASDERLSKAKVILRLSRQDAIQRELALPLAAKENLEQVVAYELDRYTPFSANQVYFAVKRLPKLSNRAEKIKVSVVLTTRQILNELYDYLDVLGISPILVDYDGVDNDIENSRDTYNLLPEQFRPKVAKIPRIIHATLIGLVFLLLAVVIIMPVWSESQIVDELSVKVQKLEKEANKIKALQVETDAMKEETQQVLNEKNATYPVLTMLNTLSTLMKDDTWLAYLQYTEGHLQMQGESPAASTLIAVLEESEVFSNVVFVSPVTQDSVNKQEHFQIKVDPTKKADVDVK